MTDNDNPMRHLPSMDRLLAEQVVLEWIAVYGRPLTMTALRTGLDELRQEIRLGTSLNEPPDEWTAALLARTAERLQTMTTPSLKPVINATGVIIHTNLGRSPLSRAALAAMNAVSMGYSNLEYDLDKGKRGSRSTHAERLIQQLTGAEAAFVVNNNASAVMLVLSALASRRKVVISRTQLVEIGGSFRIPDVMRQSGARLHEVGATNRVHLSDYEQALAEEKIALILMAHWSNFRIVGFTSEPAITELVALAHRESVPLVSDLGSGTFLDTADYGLAHETTVIETIAAGVDIVTFSGDKLLGGPQAGIIAGRADLIAKIKKHPLARAVRPDKVCLAGLNATLLHYLKDEALHAIPIWRMISADLEGLKTRAARWAVELATAFGEDNLQVIEGASTVGGGSLPGETIPTWLLAIKAKSAQGYFDRLRQQHPPIVARIQDDRVVIDPRTVLPEQDEILLAGLRHARL